MARKLSLFISVSTPETGIWCNTCMLPSAIAFEVSVLSERGVSRPHRFAGCEDCGTPIASGT